VAVIDCQPSQVSNFLRRSTAYLALVSTVLDHLLVLFNGDTILLHKVFVVIAAERTFPVLAPPLN
jgi:hypothetical protein